MKRRSYLKKVSAWPDQFEIPLKINLSPFSINGLHFNSSIDEACILGKPDDVSVMDKDCIQLDYQRKGFELEYENDRLVYAGVLVSPEHDVMAHEDARPASALLDGWTRLTTAVTPEKMIALLGAPKDDEQDEDERILTHLVHGVEVESEFTLQGELKRFSVFPES
jgi:hypothetical protein